MFKWSSSRTANEILDENDDTKKKLIGKCSIVVFKWFGYCWISLVSNITLATKEVFCDDIAIFQIKKKRKKKKKTSKFIRHQITHHSSESSLPSFSMFGHVKFLTKFKLHFHLLFLVLFCTWRKKKEKKFVKQKKLNFILAIWQWLAFTKKFSIYLWLIRYLTSNTKTIPSDGV